MMYKWRKLLSSGVAAHAPGSRAADSNPWRPPNGTSLCIPLKSL